MRHGSTGNSTSIHHTLSSPTKSTVDQDGPPLRTFPACGALPLPGAARPLANDHLHRCPAVGEYDRTVRVRRAYNEAAFLVYVEQVLGPTLRPGDVVVMEPQDRAEGSKITFAKLKA